MKPSKSTIYKRLKQGWSREAAENTPVMSPQAQRKMAAKKSHWHGQNIKDF